MISGNMEMNNAVTTLSALGHDQRLSIFRLLVRAGPHGLFAGEIAEKLDTLPNTLSANLSVLSRTGLVVSEREGRNIRYRADMDAMKQLIGFLLEDCCGGDASLCTPAFEQLTACGCGESK
jgi:ArsR family transcriptional regulator, arsenate/arsenite/antimonite-responsive transcriptional repressor